MDVPGLTKGALHMKLNKDKTGYKGLNSPPAFFSDPLRYWIRVNSSVRMAKSKMRGVANSESYNEQSSVKMTESGRGKTHTSHSLKMLIVERPPQKISE